MTQFYTRNVELCGVYGAQFLLMLRRKPVAAVVGEHVSSVWCEPFVAVWYLLAYGTWNGIWIWIWIYEQFFVQLCF